MIDSENCQVTALFCGAPGGARFLRVKVPNPPGSGKDIAEGKGAKTRNVPIMEKTCKHLKSYLHKFHTEDNPEEFLFYIDRKGIRSQMSIDNVEKFVARYGKKA